MRRCRERTIMTDLLNNSPLSALLDRLFTEAATATSPALAHFSPEKRERLMRSKTEYRELYGQLKDLWLPVSRETGKLLYMLARSTGARQIVEFGTSFGISTLHLAAALRENGGGLLISTEFEPSKVARARAHLVEAKLDDLVEIREGDALKTLATSLPRSIDLVLLDGAKSLYGDVLDLVLANLRPGALIVADNADHSPDYLMRVRDANAGFISLPFADDVELTMCVV